MSAILIGGAIIFVGNSNEVTRLGENKNNVQVVDGNQIILITAKGGFNPNTSFAQAGIPTTIRMRTQGTFDCSAILNIPQLGIRKNLPPTGDTDIKVLPHKTGEVLHGLCGMGMYNFKVNFN